MRLFYTTLLILTALYSFGKFQADPNFKLTADKTTFCSSDSARIDAIGCPGTVRWNTGEEYPWIITHQSGIYFATCLSNGAVSDTITTNVTTPIKPTVSYTLINNDKTLTASGCNGNLFWSNGMTGNSIVVSQNGTYSAYCSLAGCRSEDSNVINVTDVPKPAVSASNTKICNAEYTNLSATGCGLNADYFWNNGSTGSTISVNTIGDYWVYCIVNGETGPVSDTLQIRSLEPPRLVITAPNGTLVCPGKSITLVASECPQGIIKWNTGLTGSSITISQAGTYSVICQNICSTGVESAAVAVRTGDSPSTPNITADKTTLCPTENATLTATNCNGTVIWNDGRTGTTIEVNFSGTYSASCQNECGDSPKSNEITIKKYNLPSAPLIVSSKSVICVNETAVLIATSCVGVINWNNGATTTQIIIGESGTFNATCKNACGESIVSNSIVIRKFDNPTVPSITGSNIICTGGTTALNVSNCNGGNVIWNNSSTGNTLTVSQVGSYSAKCVNPCGESTFSNPFNIAIGTPPCVPISVLIRR